MSLEFYACTSWTHGHIQDNKNCILFMMESGQGNSGAHVITAEQWAQCEIPSCQKWRLLPPGTVLNENEPWYCHMNPDPQKNSCDAPEVVRVL